MKTLLLNGCSFGVCWTPSKDFLSNISCDQTVNLSKAGTCFQRTYRSTIEWIAQNGNPEMVMIPITFSHRWELALNKNEDDIDGSWIPLQNSVYLSDEYDLQDVSITDVKKLMDDYYKIIPTIKTYWDRMFADIIMMSGFLEHLEVPYLMWDMCNGFDKSQIKGYKGFQKIDLIAKNKRIIDIWKFCGNRFMRETMPRAIRDKTPEFAFHHASEQYKELENYLLSYISENLK
jgi:hypothetical protein